jgi:hypothetical protein
MASYPGSVKTFTTRSAGQTIGSAHINELQDEVNAIESGLLNGTAPLNSSNSTMANLVVTGGSTLASLNVTGGSTLGGAVSRPGRISVTLSTGDNHDLAPAGFSSAFAILLSGNSSGSTLTGISAPTGGRELLLIRTSASAIGIKNDAGSSAGNTIQMKSNSDTTLSVMRLWYNDVASRWYET